MCPHMHTTRTTKPHISIVFTCLASTQFRPISPINFYTERRRDPHPRQSPPGRNRFGHFHFSSIKHYWQHSQWSFVKHIELGFIVFILYRVTISPQLALAPISFPFLILMHILCKYLKLSHPTSLDLYSSSYRISQSHAYSM